MFRFRTGPWETREGVCPRELSASVHPKSVYPATEPMAFLPGNGGGRFINAGCCGGSGPRAQSTTVTVKVTGTTRHHDGLKNSPTLVEISIDPPANRLYLATSLESLDGQLEVDVSIS